MLRIDVHPSTWASFNRFRQRLSTVRRRLAHRQPGMRRVGEQEAENFLDNFDSKGRRYGAGWKGLSQVSMDLRPNRQGLLIVTGALLDNFIAQSANYTVGTTAVDWNITNDPSGHYPLSHQFALGASWNRYARKLWPQDDGDLERDRADVERVLDAWIQEVINEGW